MHNFKLRILDANFAGVKALELIKENLILVSKDDKIMIYSGKSFERKGDIPIEVGISETREPNEIIGMCLSKNEEWLAVFSGKNLVLSE